MLHGQLTRRRRWRAAGLAALVAIAVAMPATAQQPVRRIAPAQVLTRMLSGERVYFVDARSSFTGPMISGATQVAPDDVGRWAKALPKGAFVVAYCTCPAEHSAANAVGQLQRAGFTNAYALLGGLTAWSTAGYPTAYPVRAASAPAAR